MKIHPSLPNCQSDVCTTAAKPKPNAKNASEHELMLRVASMVRIQIDEDANALWGTLL